MTDAPERIWAGTAYGKTCGVDWSTSKAFGQDVEYIRADLAKPKVKPLVWVDLHGDGSLYQTCSDHPFGYCATINSRGDLGWWYFDLFNTLEEAKAAAQADYERRILEALE